MNRGQIMDFYVKRGSIQWLDVVPSATAGARYLDFFGEGVCRAIPACTNEDAAAHKARVRRISDGLRTLWPNGPVQLIQDYNALTSLVDGSNPLPVDIPNITPPWNDPFWQVLRLVMRLHAASEAPADLLGDTYEVAHGDTPMVIAAIFTGDPARYQELVDANPQIPTMNYGTVGRGPGGHRNFSSEHFRPGMQLNVPGAWRVTPPSAASSGPSR